MYASFAPPTRIWPSASPPARFRQDLFYRLNVIELRMPPLREMREDIPAIANSVLGRIAEQLGNGPA